MPELPEVEHYRRLLLPLLGQQIKFTLCSEKPPRTFVTQEQVESLQSSKLVDVLRKGKLLCLILEKSKTKRYLFLHMGMTGRISTPDEIPKLESLSSTNSYPPPHTHLEICCSPTPRACFSDPRKFGSVVLTDSLEQGFGELAPDAWTEDWSVEKLVQQAMAAKTILLDQKCVLSGVGNWVADEVLYQCEVHPDQTYLTQHEAQRLKQTLQHILDTAVDCLESNRDFPSDWMFHRRWSKRSNGAVKDCQGRLVKFVTSASRTSAICPAIQKAQSRTAQRVTHNSDQKQTVGGTNTRKNTSADTVKTSGGKSNNKRIIDSTDEKPKRRGGRLA
jgi:formamidopyrimidine-DNA glycosylase